MAANAPTHSAATSLLPCLLLPCLLLTSPAAAQQWRVGDSLPLLRRATAQRLTRDADTLLAAWRARARGVVLMASLVDHGGTSVERVIRADELEVEVYGEAPNRHKQVIVAWRDSSFLPNRIAFHRDHLGIVANDFGGILRLGEGEEVADVLHPLSPAGLASYQFAEGDTLHISGPGGTVRVVEVQVRPVNPALAGIVGTLFIDVDRAALVRFRFTFTPAAYRDPTVEDITVLLENTLQERARWLPWRQAIIIRRGQPLLDLPIRTVLRADWTIGDYGLGVVHPAGRFLGARLGIGLSDSRLLGGITVQRPMRSMVWTLGAERRLVDVGDVAAASWRGGGLPPRHAPRWASALAGSAWRSRQGREVTRCPDTVISSSAGGAACRAWASVPSVGSEWPAQKSAGRCRSALRHHPFRMRDTCAFRAGSPRCSRRVSLLVTIRDGHGVAPRGSSRWLGCGSISGDRCCAWRQGCRSGAGVLA